MTGRKLDHYSGRLQDARLLEWIANELDDEHIWSASQFNDYGMCGFRFFAKRLLKLEEMEEPEDGMDAAQRGTVIHAILEETYRQLAQRGVSITPEHLGTAIEILRAVADQILPDAPRQYGFRASVLWTQEQATLMRKVEALVRADFSDESPLGKAFKGDVRFPYMQEVPLSEANGQPLLIRIGGSVVKVVGYIDRIDRLGDRAIVLDYKTGSTKIPTSEMREGRNFQMMLYLLAGEAVLAREIETDPSAPTSIAGGTFWHLNRTTSGVMDLNKAEDQEALDEAQIQLGKHLQQGRAGNFASIANRKGSGACSHYCEFTQFCRVSSMNRRKQ
jgi:ATP-dependent helicase/DNAse subunit B